MSLLSQPDLKELELHRPGRDASTHSQSRAASRRKLISRYFVPWGIVLGFAGMMAWASREHFMARARVSVVPVVISRSDVQQAGTPLFQTPGWIEPRPTPVNVAALAEGVIEELLVVEGQSVEIGTPIARLIDADAKLTLRDAEAALLLREAELQSAEIELRAARLLVEQPVHLDSALAEARALLVQAETELAKIPFALRSAKARLEFAKSILSNRKGARDAISGKLIQQAVNEVAAAEEECRELEQREPRMAQQVQAFQEKCNALAKQRELLIAETRQLDDANAKLAVGKARCVQAGLAVEKAKLQLDRTTIRSPMQGRILELVARPGTRVAAFESSQSSSVVATLYDPKQLQVRADVRLEDVPLVQRGQPIEIETASSRGKIQGEVLTMTSSANVQKNTLEVKIAILDPPTTIRPEMFVTATFFSSPDAATEQSMSQERIRLLVPQNLIEKDKGEAAIWIVDPENALRRRSVHVGSVGPDEMIEVVEGIFPTDKIVSSDRTDLRDGQLAEIAN